MALLAASAPVKADQAAYPLLLVAAAFLATGFGLTVPVLNTYTSIFHPARVDRAVLILNALLGLGTVLAPVFVAVFVGLGFWWGLPVLSVVLLAALLVSVRLPLRAGARAGPGRAGAGGGAGDKAGTGDGDAGGAFPCGSGSTRHSRRAYGICETMNGNWSQLVMATRLGALATQASLALTAFWGMVTLGRVLFAAIGRWLPDRVVYRILPFVLVASFTLVDSLSLGEAAAGIAVFGVAGLGCSALLPLTISFGEQDLTAISGAMAGGVIAFYQLGYGLAAFGVGPLQKAGLTLSAVFGVTAIVAAARAVLSFAVTHRQQAPAGDTVGITREG
jgi:fucose permease